MNEFEGSQAAPEDATRQLKPGEKPPPIPVRRPPPPPVALPKMIGQYEIIRPLGEGGMGFVFLARDPELHREVAIKVVRKELLDNSDFVSRFMREARLSARLNHPNIVTTYQVGTQDGAPYLVLELVEGSTLRQLLQSPPPLTVVGALDVVAQCCEGLDAAARAGIVHRDIKPANIMVRRDGLVKIMDFGLSKEVHGEKLTVSTSLLGTPDYMSPEQASGDSVDFRTDIYALGITLYQCVTGYLPFKNQSVFETIRQHAEDPLPGDPRLAAIAGGRLRALVEDMTAKAVEDRISSYAALRRELLAIKADLIASGQPDPKAPAPEMRLEWQRQSSDSPAPTPKPRVPSRQAVPKQTATPSLAMRLRRSRKAHVIVIASAIIGLTTFIAGIATGALDPYLPKRAKASAVTKASPTPVPTTIAQAPAAAEDQVSITVGRNGPGRPSDLLRDLGNLGSSHLLIDAKGADTFPISGQFIDRSPEEIMTVLALACGWRLEDKDGLTQLRAGDPALQQIAAMKAIPQTPTPTISLNTHGETAFTLRMVMDALARDFSVNYLIVGEGLAERPMPKLSLTNRPLATFMAAALAGAEGCEWIYTGKTVVIIAHGKAN